MERLKKKLIGRKSGFTLIELLMVVAIIGILAAIALPVYANLQQRARIGKAQADVRTVASAISAYNGHCGFLPLQPPTAAGACETANPAAGTTALPAAVTNAATLVGGVAAGPFLASLPAPPAGWAAYSYIVTAVGTGRTFEVCSTGDGTGASSDGGTTCP